MQLSFSKLRTFQECALKYRFAYVERLPRPPIRALALQRRLHAALSHYHRLAKRDGTVRVEELLSLYAQVWGADENSALAQEKSYQDGESILRAYCERENRLGRVPAYLEHPLRVEFGPYVLTGVIDRLDFAPGGGYALLDYKLDRALPDPGAADESAQLGFYDLLVYEGLGVAPDEVRLYYLRHGMELSATRTRAQRRDTALWIQETAGGIRAEKKWEPTEGEGCRSCAFWQVCPVKTGCARPHAPVWTQGELF